MGYGLPASGYGQKAMRIALSLLAFIAIAPAIAKDDFMKPEDAYRYTARVAGDKLIVAWQIEKGYYLYRKRMSLASTTPGVTLGEPAWPRGENHHDEYFGDQEIYRGSIAVPASIVVSGTRPAKLAVDLKFQGCADAGLCYPPLTWKTEVSLPAAAAAASSAPGASSLASLIKGSGAAASGKTDDEFLSPDAAFRFGASMERPDSVALTWVIADDYYLYKDRIKVKSSTANVQLGNPVLPKGQMKHDEYFGDQEVYHEVLEASVPVARAAGSSGKLDLEVTYQGCAEAGLCYNPITKQVSLDLPPTNAATTLPAAMSAAATSARDGAAAAQPKVSEQDGFAGLVRNASLLVLLGTFFGAGLVLSLTPCVLPMIPILSGIIVGQGDRITAAKGLSLAFTYVQGMALMYGAAGAISAALFGNAPQAAFQQPWILTSFALLFVALAFAMFGAYNLELPSGLQTRLSEISNKQKGGTYVGTFIMGALSALIVTACVAPAMVGALSAIAQSGSAMRGASALYVMGIGMGVPLLIVGASAGTLLPKAGAWMDTIKSLFGVMFIGLALYVVNPLLPSALSLALWSALAIVSGFWLFSLKGKGGAPVPSPVRGFGLLVLIYGVILLIGAGSGGVDPLKPLDRRRLEVAGSGAAAAFAHGVDFKRIKTVADLDREVAAASAAGKPVMLDFYADWCVSCKEMEKYTFADPKVQAQFTNAVLLQADVTANDTDDKALMQRFNIFGPPTIAFFSADGVERKNFRLVGFSPADEFTKHVAEAFSST